MFILENISIIGISLFESLNLPPPHTHTLPQTDAEILGTEITPIKTSLDVNPLLQMLV